MSHSFETPWTIALQTPLSMGFPKQEYWSGLPFSSLGDLPGPGIEPSSPALQVDSLPLSHPRSPYIHIYMLLSHFSHVWLCDPIDSSPPGSSVPGILQARTLEWVAINAWKWKVKGKLLSRVRLFMTPWIAAYQAPLSMGFSRQEYWSGLPLPSYIYIPELSRQRHRGWRKVCKLLFLVVDEEPGNIVTLCGK